VHRGHRHVQGVVRILGRHHRCGQVGLGEFFDLGAGIQDVAGIEGRRKDLSDHGRCILQLRFRDEGSDQPPLSGFGLLPKHSRVRHPFGVVVAADDRDIEIQGLDVHKGVGSEWRLYKPLIFDCFVFAISAAVRGFFVLMTRFV